MYERVWPQLSKHNQQSDSSKGNIGGEGQGLAGFGLGGDLLTYGSLTEDKDVRTGSVQHRRAWEAGHVDYQGRDSFTNIQEQLEKNIAQKQQYHPAQQRQTTPPKQNNQASSATSGNTTTASDETASTGVSGVLKTTTTTTTTSSETK